MHFVTMRRPPDNCEIVAMTIMMLMNHLSDEYEASKRLSMLHY